MPLHHVRRKQDGSSRHWRLGRRDRTGTTRHRRSPCGYAARRPWYCKRVGPGRQRTVPARVASGDRGSSWRSRRRQGRAAWQGPQRSTKAAQSWRQKGPEQGQAAWMRWSRIARRRIAHPQLPPVRRPGTGLAIRTTRRLPLLRRMGFPATDRLERVNYPGQDWSAALHQGIHQLQYLGGRQDRR